MQSLIILTVASAVASDFAFRHAESWTAIQLMKLRGQQSEDCARSLWPP